MEKETEIDQNTKYHYVLKHDAKKGLITCHCGLSDLSYKMYNAHAESFLEKEKPQNPIDKIEEIIEAEWKTDSAYAFPNETSEFARNCIIHYRNFLAAKVQALEKNDILELTLAGLLSEYQKDLKLSCSSRSANIMEHAMRGKRAILSIFKEKILENKAE